MKYCCKDFRLHNLVVNGVAHDWFRSYLIGRHQYVRSPSKPVVYGPHALRCTARIGSRPDLISIVHVPLTSQHSSGVMDYICPPLC